MPLTGPHKPALPHPDFAGKSGLGPYADLVMEVDHTVRSCDESPRNSRCRRQYMFIYTSDNGSYMFRRKEGESGHVADSTVQGYLPENHTANADWRGTKADIWEAGHRVPFILRYPGFAEAGTQIDQTICLTDVLSTVCEIVGQPHDLNQSEDSYSFLPLLTEESVERPPVVHHSVGGMFSIRKGDFKLVFGNGSGGREKPRGENFGKPYQLFNLREDPAEQTDLAADAEYTATMEEMEADLVRILEQREGHGVDLEAL